jgi:putative membrane protein
MYAVFTVKGMAMYGSDYGSSMHGSGMFGGGLVMILMWLVPIVLVVALIVFLTKRPGFGSGKKTALDILKERYARGEIGKDEFDQSKNDIGN